MYTGSGYAEQRPCLKRTHLRERPFHGSSAGCQHPRLRHARPTTTRKPAYTRAARSGWGFFDSDIVQEEIDWLDEQRDVPGLLKRFPELELAEKRACLRRTADYIRRLEIHVTRLLLSSEDPLAGEWLGRLTMELLPETSPLPPLSPAWEVYFQRSRALLGELRRLVIVESDHTADPFQKALARKAMADLVGAACEEWEEVCRREQAAAEAAAAAGAEQQQLRGAQGGLGGEQLLGMQARGQRGAAAQAGQNLSRQQQSALGAVGQPEHLPAEHLGTRQQMQGLQKHGALGWRLHWLVGRMLAADQKKQRGED